MIDMVEFKSFKARRVKQRRREAGETAPRPRGGAAVIKIDLDRLAGLVKQRPDATIKELHALLGVDCVESAVCLALKRLGLSFKKKRSARRSKTARTRPGAAPRGSESNRKPAPNV
ncbi:MAG: IS630 transposase-related protein [Planctomycetes bacterium]|nr:IS630 transposase-related protein [Planctomycetota bacterium]